MTYVRTVQYHDKAYLAIKDMAITFEIKPSQQINILELAERLNVSQTPVREALNRLFNEKLIARGSGRGFYGRTIDAQEYQDLVYMRGTLVAGSVRQVFKSTSPQALDDIVGYWRRLHDPDRRHAESTQPLYSRILQITNNREILDGHNRIMERISYLWQGIIAHQAMSSRYFSFQERLIDAIENRDLAGVESAIEDTAMFEAGLVGELISRVLIQLYSVDRSRQEIILRATPPNTAFYQSAINQDHVAKPGRYPFPGLAGMGLRASAELAGTATKSKRASGV